MRLVGSQAPLSKEKRMFRWIMDHPAWKWLGAVLLFTPWSLIIAVGLWFWRH